MATQSLECVSWDQIQDAERVVQADSNVIRTPLFRDVAQRIGVTTAVKSLHLKLENTQVTGE